MNAKELAEKLNGIEYPCHDIDERLLIKGAKEAGLVVVYGLSDDLMEFRGAINDELGANNGCVALVDVKGLIPDRSEVEDDDDAILDCLLRKNSAKTIEALWCEEGSGYSWTFKTDIPHETFEIVEDGEKYCRGIVFALADAGQQKKTTGMHFGLAYCAMMEGHKIALPEWKGYWFIEDGKVKVMRSCGDVVNTPHFDTYIQYSDWMIVE